MTESIRLLIVDDHKMVREGLRAFFQFAEDILVVGEADTAAGALQMTRTLAPDVILMDLVLGQGSDGIDAITAVAKDFPQVHMIALSSYTDSERIIAAIKAGAHGFLQKTVEPDELLGAIRQVVTGKIVLEPLALAALRESTANTRSEPLPAHPAATHSGIGGAAAPEPLTPRERDVLNCLAKGLANKQIGAELGITEKTVKVHVSHILAKLGVYDRTGAILAAARLKWIDLS
ncbi:MAG: response regulator [Bacilli bacterium]